MTVEPVTVASSKESPLKSKRKRVSRSSSSGSSSSGSTSSSSASSRSSSSSSSNSSSSSSRSSSATSSPEKPSDRGAGKTTSKNKSSGKKSHDHDDKHPAATSSNQPRASLSPPPRAEKEPESTKVYIGRLSLNVNKEHLLEIFGTFGDIKEIDLPAHRIHPHLHRGFAHIEYVAPVGAEQACKYMEGGQIDGREIVCALIHGHSSQVSSNRGRREPSPYRRRRRTPPPRFFASRRPGDRDRDRDRGRYNDRRPAYSPPSRNYRRGPSPGPGRRSGPAGSTAESPKKKERRYSRTSSSESK